MRRPLRRGSPGWRLFLTILLLLSTYNSSTSQVTRNNGRGLSSPAGTWYANANGYRLTLVITATGAGFSGVLVNEQGETEVLENVVWDAPRGLLEFRRNLSPWFQWYRLNPADGVLTGRYTHLPQAEQPADLTAYRWRLTGWNAELGAALAPRVYDLNAEGHRARLRLDAAPGRQPPFQGRLKFYAYGDELNSCTHGEYEQLEEEVVINVWDGVNLSFQRRTQSYFGQVSGRTISGSFTEDGLTHAWSGVQAEVLTYGAQAKTAAERDVWQQLTRRRLWRLTMAGNPVPEQISLLTKEVRIPPRLPSILPNERDDNPLAWPPNYSLTRFELEFVLTSLYSNAPVKVLANAYLALPTVARYTGDKLPLVIALNGHGGNAWEMFNPENCYFWYGDGFARRGFAVLAVDIGHRAPEQDSPLDWEEDGERAWTVLRVLDWVLGNSGALLDASRLVVTGLSLGGEVATYVAALDPRIAVTISAGYSPDFSVLTYRGSCGCWQWDFADIREYLDSSELFALIAPRPLLIETGRLDDVYSNYSLLDYRTVCRLLAEDTLEAARLVALNLRPFASDKQIARRVRAAYAAEAANFVHYLHYDWHAYHFGDLNPNPNPDPLTGYCVLRLGVAAGLVRPPGIGLTTPVQRGPEDGVDWQIDPATQTEGRTLIAWLEQFLQLQRGER